LGEVDVALCFSPTPHPDVQLHPVRIEPRVVVLSKTHHLADRSELAVQDVLHETFCGDDPSLEPVRAGFWKLDDHRGAPAKTTTDRASNAFELLSCISTGRSIATGPASSVAPLVSGMPGLAAIPLRDARPTVLCLVSRTSNRNPLVDAIVAMARSRGNGPSGSAGQPAPLEA